jgi:hypothetical protein
MEPWIATGGRATPGLRHFPAPGAAIVHGGALRYRAQGASKKDFGPTVNL